MADDIVDVKPGGDAGPAKKAIEDARRAQVGVGGYVCQSEVAQSPVTEFQAALAGLASVLAGGAMFKGVRRSGQRLEHGNHQAFQGDGDDRRGSQRDGGCVEAYRP